MKQFKKFLNLYYNNDKLRNSVRNCNFKEQEDLKIYLEFLKFEMDVENEFNKYI